MGRFTASDRRELARTAAGLRRGQGVTPALLMELESRWIDRAEPEGADANERFGVVLPDGTQVHAFGPRWLFHLVGLPHRAAHVGLFTSNGLLLLQRRGRSRSHWPGMIDCSVSGHVPLGPGDADVGYEEGAWKEISEEIGLSESRAAEQLVEGRLAEVGGPYYSYDSHVDCETPFFNSEVRQIYTASLTASGLSACCPGPDEVDQLLFVTEEEAWHLLETEPVASGARYSLPRLLHQRELDRMT